MGYYKKGMLLGPWTLDYRLGRGGNGEVWKAYCIEQGFVALKILKRTDLGPDSESYKRFRDEIELSLKLRKRQGVIQAKDAYVPKRKEDMPPWLATEIAIPIKKALAHNSSLEDIIGAIADISVTLSGLHQEAIYHRDIKPENLFKAEDGWAVGDFGIASYPNKQALTIKGRKLGPMWYIAPEMLTSAEAAAGGPADVFSLAKTLWVLVAQQNYPPQGQLRNEIYQITLKSYFNHPRIAMIDTLLEKSTDYDPKARPTMSQFAEELRAWLRKPTKPTPPEDISEEIARMRPILARLADQKENRQRHLETFEKVLSKVCIHLKPFQVLCRRDLMGIEQTESEVNSPIQTSVPGFLEELLPTPDETRRSLRHECPRIEAGCLPSGVSSINISGQASILYWGIYDLRLFEGGDAFFQAAHIVETCFHRTPQQVESKYEVVWRMSQRAPIISALAESKIDDLMESWSKKFREATEKFVSVVENNT